MYHYSTVANSSLFQTTSHLTQTLLKYSVLNIDKIAELQQTVHSILKRLKASELESLLRALESRGGDVSKCVFVPSDVENEPEVTLYQIFRQPSIASANDLKPLAVCSHRDGKRVCINPYHYSRLVHIGCVSSEKKSLVMFESKEEESSGIDSNYSDFTRSTVCTSLGNSTSSLCESEYIPKFKDWPKRSWCCIAYWEHNERVGPLYYESEDILNVFETLPVLKAKGLCLATLNKPSRVENVIKRVRHHIGYGLQLSREHDGVWMYNRSDYALFANGPTLSERTSDGTCRQNVLVHKVPPGYSLRLWDYNSSHLSTHRHHSAPRSVRVSFAKGWGNTASSSYRRQFVTSCPCWIEIHFFV